LLLREEALEGAIERPGVVLLVEQAIGAANSLPDRAVEDLRALLLVEGNELLRRKRIGCAEGAGKDPSRRGSGDQVEQLEDPFAASSLELRQHERRNDPADPAAVDREHTHASRHESEPTAWIVYGPANSRYRGPVFDLPDRG
jgi:hypothetical protein